MTVEDRREFLGEILWRYSPSGDRYTDAASRITQSHVARHHTDPAVLADAFERFDTMDND